MIRSKGRSRDEKSEGHKQNLLLNQVERESAVEIIEFLDLIALRLRNHCYVRLIDWVIKYLGVWNCVLKILLKIRPRV